MYALAEWATPTNHVNQAMVWSRIVQQRRAARVKEVVRIEYPYALTDQGAHRHPALLQPCHASQIPGACMVLSEPPHMHAGKVQSELMPCVSARMASCLFMGKQLRPCELTHGRYDVHA